MAILQLRSGLFFLLLQINQRIPGTGHCVYILLPVYDYYFVFFLRCLAGIFHKSK